MSPIRRSILFGGLLALAITTPACGGSDDPEIVAISYLRAIHEGRADEALRYVDMARLLERIQDEIVMVQTPGDSETFMRDSVETVVWGLFHESPREDYAYDAVPAEVDGEMASVVVKLTDPDGTTTERTVHLRRTDDGWRISGPSLDRLETYVTQRLEERY